MEFRSKMARCMGFFIFLAFAAAPVGAQVETVQRIAGMVAIAADEYGKGIDAQGRLISNDEYQEAVGFLSEARTSAGRLPAERRGPAAILDSLIAAVNSRRPVAEVKALASRFAAALGSGAALDLPKLPLDPDSGGRIYASTCASCHGPRGMGDGAAAKGMNPAPPAIGTATFMRSVAPSLMFQKVSVGVKGTAMPAFADKFSAADRWNVIAYLTELRHRGIDSAHRERL
jgi:high-affinity iron transporter